MICPGIIDGLHEQEQELIWDNNDIYYSSDGSLDSESNLGEGDEVFYLSSSDCASDTNSRLSNDHYQCLASELDHHYTLSPLSIERPQSAPPVMEQDSYTTGSSYDYGNYINIQNLDQNDIFSSQDDITSYDETIIDNNLYFLSNIGTRSDSDYYDIQTTADLTTSHETFSTCASVVSSTNNTSDTVFTPRSRKQQLHHHFPRQQSYCSNHYLGNKSKTT